MSDRYEDDRTADHGNPDPETSDGDAALSLEWTSHPVRRRPMVSVMVTVFVFVVSAMVFYSTDSRAFTVLALVIMFASLAKFYFPTRYNLTDDRITIRTTTQTLHKKWSQYRSCYPDKNGILLSPFPEPSRLESFRGLYIMFGDNRDDVVAFVKAHIGGKSAANMTADLEDKRK